MLNNSIKTCYLLLCFFGLWLSLVLIVNPNIYWRDSAEFITSAFFLDIAHPAGFPVYSQLANLFALIPIGPVAFRINLFSTFIGLLLVFIIQDIQTKFIRLQFQSYTFSNFDNFLRLVSNFFILFSIPAFARQLISSEVYILNAIFFLILLNLFLNFRISKDSRLVIIASFISGLALANHASILLTFPIFILSITKDLKNIWKGCLLAGLFGLSIYAYIPVRAANNPPLNTSHATTIQRFSDLITDARDRKLRHTSATPLTNQHTQTSKISNFTLTKSDLKHLANQMPIWLYLISGLGLIISFKNNWQATLVVFLLGSTNLIFFSGWDPDPWTILFCCLTIFSGTSFAIASNFNQKYLTRFILSLILIALGLNFNSNLRQIIASKKFDLTRSVAIETIQDLPANSTLIAEVSWFSLAYLQSVEEYRSDLTIVHLPAISFPLYFNPVEIKSNQNQHYDYQIEQSQADLDQQKLLKNFIIFASSNGKLFVEPGQAINQLMSAVIQINHNLTYEIQTGKYFKIDPDFESNFINLYFRTNEITQEYALFSADSREYLMSKATSNADLLDRSIKDSSQSAFEFLKKICQPLNSCNSAALNNLIVYGMRSGNLAEAAQIGLATLKFTQNATISFNTNLILKQLKTDQKHKNSH